MEENNEWSDSKPVPDYAVNKGWTFREHMKLSKEQLVSLLWYQKKKTTQYGLFAFMFYIIALLLACVIAAIIAKGGL